jgi:hypothetical protein
MVSIFDFFLMNPCTLQEATQAPNAILASLAKSTETPKPSHRDWWFRVQNQLTSALHIMQMGRE